MKAALAAIISGFAVLAPAAVSAQELAGRDHAYVLLLLSESESEVKFAARALYRTQSTRQDVLDLLAEMFWTACSGKRALDTDTVAWLAKALGSTKQARYAGVLDDCLSRTNDGKTKKYVLQARAALAEQTIGDSFEGGKLDFRNWHDRLAKVGTVMPHDQLEASLRKLTKNQTINEVYVALGPPSKVGIASLPGQRIGHGLVKVQTETDVLVATYSGVGTVRFIFGHGVTEWLLAEATSAKGWFWSSGDGRFVTIDDQIAGGDGSQLREIASHLLESRSLDRDTLDRIAARIHRSRQDQNDQTVDGLAWLCKVLGKSQDGRYRSFLLDVANTATHEKLRKYAARIGPTLPVSSTDPYPAASN